MLAAALLAIATGIAPALAQAAQCHAPLLSSVPALPRPDGPVSTAPIAGYTFALSWSPEFCHGRADDARFATQCGGSTGHFGFIVHGLWPEAAAGAPPQWCPAPAQLDAEAVRGAMCTTPSADLLAHEWAKHGACMVQTPATYFRIERRLFDALRLPDMARLSHRPGLNAGMVREAFAQRNPLLRSETIRLKLSQSGWLQEVELCYGKDFLPVRCAARDWKPDDRTSVKIWRSAR